MSTTTTTSINPVNSSNSKDNKKKAAAFAATAAAAVGAGVGAANFMSGLDDADESVLDDVLLDEVIEDAANPEGSATGAATTNAETAASHPSSAASTSANTVEPQPITANDAVEADVVIETEVTVEPEVTASSEPAAETVAQDSSTTVDMTDEFVNPDEIAEAIIAEEKIDPNDIDMVDIVNFDEIGTVYTVDGESYTAAAFHDDAGNDYIMIDVDGDDVFDVIADGEGNLIAEVPGNISVGDAQEDIEDDGEYLAYDEDYDNVDEFGADSLADDLMA